MIPEIIRDTVFIGCGNFFSLLAYVAISVIAGIALVAAGYYLVRL